MHVSMMQARLASSWLTVTVRSVNFENLYCNMRDVLNLLFRLVKQEILVSLIAGNTVFDVNQVDFEID